MWKGGDKDKLYGQKLRKLWFHLLELLGSETMFNIKVINSSKSTAVAQRAWILGKYQEEFVGVTGRSVVWFCSFQTVEQFHAATRCSRSVHKADMALKFLHLIG